MSETDSPVTPAAVFSCLWSWRGLVARAGALGVCFGLVFALMSERVYESTAVLLPDAGESGMAGLAAAAGQFGIELPSGGASWSPALLASVVRGPAVLGRLVADSVRTSPDAPLKPLVDLLEYPGKTVREKRAWAQQEMLGREMVVREDKRTGTVVVTLSTRWPEVSLSLADAVVRYAEAFDVAVRQAKAGEERRFAEAEAQAAERALREAESKLRSFLRANRQVEMSPDLVFERDRLRRDVDLRQQLFTSLLQSRDQAALRESRQVPIITVVQRPTLAVLAAPRRRVLKMAASVFVSVALALILVVVLSAIEPFVRERGRFSPSFERFVDRLFSFREAP